MLRFHVGPKVCEILHLPHLTQSTTFFVKKKKKKENPKERHPEGMSRVFWIWWDKKTIQHNPGDLNMVGQTLSREKAFVPGPGTMMI